MSQLKVVTSGKSVETSLGQWHLRGLSHFHLALAFWVFLFSGWGTAREPLCLHISIAIPAPTDGLEFSLQGMLHTNCINKHLLAESADVF